MASSFSRTSLAELLVYVAVLLAFSFTSLELPPDGDSAMGLFPAAIWLSENGFDLPGLIDQPGFWDGGPNNYAISPVVWVVALVVKLVGHGKVTLVVLRLLWLGLTAAALTGLRRLALPVLGTPGSWLLALAVMVYPVFLVQSQTIYFDMPLFFCAVAAMRAWVAGRPRQAALFGVAAALVKPTGVLVGAALALVAVTRGGPIRRNLGEAARQLLPATVPVVIEMWTKAAPAGSLFPENPGFGVYMQEHLLRFLRLVPDVAVLVVLAGFVAVVRLIARSRVTPIERACDALVLGFCGFFLLAPPLTGYLVYVLPRYFVLALPFAMLSIAGLLRRRAGDRALLGVLGVVLLLLLANQSGALYPASPDNEYSVAERSAEARDVVALRREAIGLATEWAGDRPLVVSLFDWFHVRHPLLGYVEAPPSDVRCHAIDPGLRPGRSASWPRSFVLLRTFDGNQTAAVNRLLHELSRRDPGRLRPRELRRGRLRMLVVDVAPE